MAKLHKDPYPGFAHPESFADDVACMDWVEEQGAKLTKLELTGNVISFPVADGYAYYFIVSKAPLVLQHIPYGDG